MTNAALLQRLQQEVSSVEQNLAQFKANGTVLNEAMTEFVVIDPLLNALGYKQWEILKQGVNPTVGNIPDYTLLPSTAQTWFLEVKKFGLTLSDREASQAVTYASNHGKRWAVLTNGREWWIYHAHLPVPLSEKRVLQIADVLAGPQALEQLALLARDAMPQDALTQFWMQAQAASVVRAELDNPNSPARQALRDAVSASIHQPVSDALVADALTPLLSPVVPLPPPPLLPPLDKSYTIARLKASGRQATGTKATAVTFADGERLSVKSWADAATAVVAHYGATQLPPLPFFPGTGAKCFLNTIPSHNPDFSMQSSRQIELQGQVIYIDTNRSVRSFMRALSAFLQAIGISPDDVTVHLA